LCGLDADSLLPDLAFGTETDLFTLTGFFNSLMSLKTTPGAVADQAYNGAPTGMKWAAWLIVYAGAGVLSVGGAAIDAAAFTSGCGSPNYVSMKIYLALLGFLNNWVAPIFGKIGTTANYYDSWLCPQQIPSTADAQSAYLANAITDSLLDTWTAANNDCPIPARTILEARRSKLTPVDIVSLFRRGLIDEEAYNERIRELGYIRTDDPDEIIALSNQVPPVSELIRMMVRDVADEQLVTDFDLDADFGKKWIGQLKEWGYQQGITDQFAKYEWRAHWSIPSPGQLYEMYHRYRNLPPNDPLYVNIETIKSALKQQDIAPFWVDRLLGTSFRLITRSDIIQMMYYGTMTSQQAKTAVSQLGYDDDASDLYVKYLQRRRSLRARTHPYVRSYIRGDIPADAVSTRLQLDGYEQTDIDDVVSYADVLRTARTSAVCRSSVKKKFMLGEIDFSSISGQLISYGYDLDEANDFASAWLCERSARIKQQSAEKLCKWFAAGIIDATDFSTRLTNIGYKPLDVINIMTACQQGIDKKAAAEQAKQLAKAEREAEQAAKKIAQAEKQAAAAAAKAAKQVDAMQKKAQARQKAIVKAAEIWSHGCGGSVTDALDGITAAVAWIRSNTELTYDESISAAMLAAEQMDGKASCDWPSVFKQVATAWHSAQQDSPGPLDPIDGNGVAISGGPFPSSTPSPGPSPTN
jgi:hypothetical protein